jgi:putative redox protein
MASITSSIKKEPYKVTIESPTGNVLIADEPQDMGGKDLGFSPKELLVSALAACTSATLRMYANHKGWDFEEVKLDISLDWDAKANKTTIHRNITFIGALDDAQKKRLLSVANACPVHKMLTNTVEINTVVV